MGVGWGGGGRLAWYSTIKEMGPPHRVDDEHGQRAVCRGDLLVEVEALVEVDVRVGLRSNVDEVRRGSAGLGTGPRRFITMIAEGLEG